MSFQSLSFKVALIGSMVVAAIVGLGTLILVTKVSTVVDAQTDALEHKTIANEADLVRERLNMAAASADALASTFEMLQASGIKERSVYDAVLRAVAERNPDFLGTWAGWEPNALDGRDADFAGKTGYDATGRFLSYWNRAAGAVSRDVLTAYETDPYYLAPQKLDRPVAVEPYFYPVAGQNHLIMSLGIPLKSNGVTVGTIGIDVDLTRLYGSLAHLKPFGTGHLAIVSAGGMTVVHPAPESAGKPLDTIDARAADVSRRAIETKATARLDAVGPDGQFYHYVAEPVQAGNSQETWAAIAAIPLATLTAASEQVKWTMIIIAFVSVVVVGVLLFTLLSMLLGRPLRALGRTVDAMATGDYDRAVQQASRRDEIGTIGQAIERFREALKTRAAQDADREARLRAERAAEGRNLMMRLADQFEVEVGSVVDLVSSSALRLQRTAQTLTSVADNSTSESGIVKEAALEASLNVAKIATSADELGASVEEISRKVAGSAALSREAADEASASAVVIDELSRAATEIGDIVKVISAIARQTNLLALNATIEASRAGDTGQGFAVVATEVKTLATNTANATDAINQKISAIQASAGRAVETSHAINQRIHAINATTTTVAGMVGQQGVATLDIVKAVRQASIGTGDVTGSIETVATAAQETGDEAEKVLTAASDLTNQSAQLRGVVNAFLASVRAA